MQSAHKWPLGARPGYGQPLVPRAQTSGVGAGGLGKVIFHRVYAAHSLRSLLAASGAPRSTLGCRSGRGCRVPAVAAGWRWCRGVTGSRGCAGVGGESGGALRMGRGRTRPQRVPTCSRCRLEGGQGSAASSTRPDSAPSLPLARLLAARGERGQGQGTGTRTDMAALSQPQQASYDAIVIGAGIQGSFTAFHLAQRHRDTLLLEQVPASPTPPRPQPCHVPSSAARGRGPGCPVPGPMPCAWHRARVCWWHDPSVPSAKTPIFPVPGPLCPQ